MCGSVHDYASLFTFATVSYCSAVLRSVFKMVVSLFVPLIIFFFVLDKGRTRYDQLFQSAVVDVSTLHRPVPIVGDRVQQIQLQ